MSKCALYRHWDKYGNLIYVGISKDPYLRLRGHKHKSKWFCEIKNISIEWFDSKRLAQKAEIYAIKTEHPKFNTRHSAIDVEEAKDNVSKPDPEEKPKAYPNRNLYYTVEDVVNTVRISRSFLYNLWSKNEGPPYEKIGRKTLIRKDDLEKWLDSLKSE